MKKIFIFLGCFFCSFLVLNCVKAAGARMPIASYDVFVNVEDGIKIEDDVNSIIPYNTKMTITQETFLNGVWYGATEYGGKYVRIKLEDVKLVTEKFPLERAKKLEKEQKLFVFEEEGIDVYDGPSAIYSKNIKKIPNKYIYWNLRNKAEPQ